MENTGAEILKWESYIANSSVESREELIADFAQLLWNGLFDSRQQIRLLKSESAIVRRAVAWAISDSPQCGKALDFLIECSCRDPNPSVRQSSIMAVRNARHLATIVKKKKIQKIFEVDADADVKTLAQRILDDIEEQGVLKWTPLIKPLPDKNKVSGAKNESD